MIGAENHCHQNQAGLMSRLGERSIDVELPSQAAVMQALCPLAQSVEGWCSS